MTIQYDTARDFSSKNAPPYEADADQIRRFLSGIFRHRNQAPAGACVRLCSFPNDGDKPEDDEAKLYPKPRWLMLEDFEEFQGAAIAKATEDGRAGLGDRGYNLTFDAYAYGDKRKGGGSEGKLSHENTNIVACFALVVDVDKVSPSEALRKLTAIYGATTFLVESGGLWAGPNGEIEPKIHGYLVLTKPALSKEELGKVKDIQTAICTLIGADPSVAAWGHPVRIPGSLHTKTDPRLCRIVSGDPDREFDLDELYAITAKAMEDVGLPMPNNCGPVERVSIGAVEEIDDDLLDKIVDGLPNSAPDFDLPYDDWRNVGLALVNVTGGLGEDHFHTFSEKSDKYDPDTTEAVWSEMCSRPLQGIGKPWLLDRLQRQNRKAWGLIMAELWYEPLPADTPKADPNWRARLAVDGGNKPQPLSVLKNAIIAFRHAPEWNGVLARDLFRHKTMMMRPAPFMKGNHERFAPREWTDIDDTMTTEWLQDQRIYVKQTVTMPAIEAVASENGFDPLEDYVLKLNWDGVPRLRKWLPTYLGCEDTPYVQAVGEKFAVAAIARAIRPGCKADAMLILEGEQGKRKSTAIKVLGGEFYCDAMTDIGGKDGAMLAAGFWIHELPELDAFNRSETTKIKADLSRTEDVYRPPYGRRIVRAPRRCVFIGSTNQTAYLKDETGGRRFWPVACGEIEIDALKRDRDQLWAEAFTLFQSGATWWLDTPELVEAASRAQSARYSEDPWDEAISRYLQEHEDVSVAEVLSSACHIPTARHDQHNKNRVAKSLRSLGYERFQKRTDHGRVWRYRSPLSPVEDGRLVTNPVETGDSSAPAGR